MMGSARTVLESFERHARIADVTIVEGVMGMFNGRDGTSEDDITAQIAKLLGAPLVLVVDASAMALSVATVVLGYTVYEKEMWLGRVVVNRVSGANPQEMDQGRPGGGYKAHRCRDWRACDFCGCAADG